MNERRLSLTRPRKVQIESQKEIKQPKTKKKSNWCKPWGRWSLISQLSIKLGFFLVFFCGTFLCSTMLQLQLLTQSLKAELKNQTIDVYYNRSFLIVSSIATRINEFEKIITTKSNNTSQIVKVILNNKTNPQINQTESVTSGQCFGNNSFLNSQVQEQLNTLFHLSYNLSLGKDRDINIYRFVLMKDLDRSGCIWSNKPKQDQDFYNKIQNLTSQDFSRFSNFTKEFEFIRSETLFGAGPPTISIYLRVSQEIIMIIQLLQSDYKRLITKTISELSLPFLTISEIGPNSCISIMNGTTNVQFNRGSELTDCGKPTTTDNMQIIDRFVTYNESFDSSNYQFVMGCIPQNLTFQECGNSSMNLLIKVAQQDFIDSSFWLLIQNMIDEDNNQFYLIFSLVFCMAAVIVSVLVAILVKKLITNPIQELKLKIQKNDLTKMKKKKEGKQLQTDSRLITETDQFRVSQSSQRSTSKFQVILRHQSSNRPTTIIELDKILRQSKSMNTPGELDSYQDGQLSEIVEDVKQICCREKYINEIDQLEHTMLKLFCTHKMIKKQQEQSMEGPIIKMPLLKLNQEESSRNSQCIMSMGEGDDKLLPNQLAQSRISEYAKEVYTNLVHEPSGDRKLIKNQSANVIPKFRAKPNQSQPLTPKRYYKQTRSNMSTHPDFSII